jgi:hypothetical protein
LLIHEISSIIVVFYVLLAHSSQVLETLGI